MDFTILWHITTAAPYSRKHLTDFGWMNLQYHRCNHSSLHTMYTYDNKNMKLQVFLYLSALFYSQLDCSDNFVFWISAQFLFILACMFYSSRIQSCPPGKLLQKFALQGTSIVWMQKEPQKFCHSMRSE